MIYHADETVSEGLENITISSVTPGASVCKEPSCLQCNMCLEEDSLDHSCRGWKCRASYRFDDHSICPYFFCIPKGADFNRQDYAITCTCGNVFNEDKWSCTDCPSTGAVIRQKACIFCNGSGHATYECPEDKVRSVKIKLSREKQLAEIPTFIPIDTVDFDSFDFGLEEENYAPLPLHGIVNNTKNKSGKILHPDPVYPVEWFLADN